MSNEYLKFITKIEQREEKTLYSIIIHVTHFEFENIRNELNKL